MGCNCNKDGSIPLSVRKENRRKLKERIEAVKKIWRESKDGVAGKAVVSKDELGFK
jgi:hypothetical protein